MKLFLQKSFVRYGTYLNLDTNNAMKLGQPVQNFHLDLIYTKVNIHY